MDMKLPRWKRREFTRNAVLAGLGLAGVSAAGCTTTTAPTTTAPTTAATTTAVPTTTAIVGGTLTTSMVTEPTTLNPLLEKKFGHYACIHIFDRPAVWRYAGSGFEVVPSAVKSFEFNSDNTQCVMELDNVKLSSGEAFTADDLIYNIQVRIDSDLAKNTLNVASLNLVSGYAQFGQLTIKLPITKVDDHTVQVNFTSKAPFFAELMASPEMGLVKKDKMLADLAGFARNPVGSGPFKFKEWVTADHLTIERNPNWWAGSVNLDSVIFKITPQEATRFTELQTGVTQVMAETTIPFYAQATADPNITKSSTPTFDQLVLTFRNKGTGSAGFPMNDKRFREVVAFALDWPGFLQGLYPELYRDGQAQPDWGYLNNTWAYDSNREQTWPYKYNKSAAQAAIEILKQDANNPTKGSIRKLTLVTRADKSSLTDYVVTQLRSLGLDVDHVVLDIPSYVTRVQANKDYDITIWNYRGYGSDPSLRLREQFSSAGRFFDNGFYNDVIDNLIAQGVNTADKDQRIAIYRQLDLAAQNDLVEIPTFSLRQISTLRKDVHDYYSQGVYPLFRSPINNVWKG